MDYKEKYEMALEGIQEILGSGEDSIKMSRLQLRLQGIFPELKESEDEKMRKHIIEVLKDNFSGEDTDRCIAWLEKQGDKQQLDGTFVNVDDVREDFVQEVYRVLDADSTNDRANQIIDAFDNLPTVTIENQNEQKPAEVEPKFKVGDIIKHKKHGFTCKIIAVDTEYKLSDGLYLPFDFQDAYELVEQNPIECSEDNLPEFESYLCLMFQKFRIKYSTEGICTNGEIIDYVMEHSQKLKDTLCHAWSEEDELNLSEALHHIRMYNLADKADKLDKWLKSLKDRVQPQPKCEWSEEDERTYKSITGFFTYNYPLTIQQQEFIKSLKERCAWKPSDEQMEALDRALRFYGKGTAVYDSVKELLEQLKKLKG